MERKLISNQPLSSKIGVVFAFLVLSFAELGAIASWNWMAVLMVSLIYIEVIWLARRLFTSKHRVYFDDNAIYWGKPGNEQVVPLNTIQQMIYRNWGNWICIKYFDSENKARSFHFYNTLTFFDEVLTFNNLADFRKFLEEKNPPAEIKFSNWLFW